jgi:alkylated DNA repair dioxygenase AlkB
MDTLFPIEPILPAGFSYHENFLAIEEEQRLCKEILKMNLHTFLFQGFEAKRKVASFGYDWSFEKRTLSKGKDIPSIFDPLINKVAAYLQIDRDQFAELLVTEYPIGSVINWHRDAPPFDIIAGISLLSDCTFKLRPHDRSKQSRGSVVSLPVRRRSLYIIQGSARSEWEHSIAPVKELRYSITLRTLGEKN